MASIPLRNPSTELACGLAEEIVRSFGEVRLRVFGTSMVPCILPGDVVAIRRACVREISRGDVVLYSRKGRLFVHRVVNQIVSRSATDLEEPCLITRGDRLAQDDPPVQEQELLGRVMRVERGNRNVEFSARAHGSGQWILRLMLASDRATFLYLRLAAFREAILRKETP
jgi:signal peptidase I